MDWTHRAGGALEKQYGMGSEGCQCASAGLPKIFLCRDLHTCQRNSNQASIRGYSALKNSAPSGGSVRLKEKGRPWAGTASAVAPPPLPTLLPP